MDNKLLLAVTFKGIDKLTGPMRNIIGAGKTGAQALKGMRDESKRLAQQLAEVRRQIEAGSGNMTALVNRERELARAAANANMELATQRQRLAQIATIHERGAAITARADRLKDKGQANATAGAAMLAPLLLIVRASTQFQDGMIDIRQKANLTAIETERMAQGLLASARAARQLPEDMRAGIDVLSGFGMDPREAMRLILPIGRFVTAYRADMAEVSQASFAGIDNLKIPLGEVTRLLDIMAFSGKAGAFEAKDLAANMPALSAAYQGLGQQGLTAFAQLAAGAEIARKGAGNSEVAGNNLLNLLNKLTSTDAMKNFSKQGIDLAAELKKSKDPLETIVMLAQKATRGDPMKLNMLFQDAQVLGALRPLMANLPEYRKMRDEALKAAGTTDADFEMRSNGAGSNWNLLMGKMQRIAIISGSLLLPVLNQVMGSIGDVADRVADWAQRNPELAGTILTGIGYLAAFRIGLGALQFGLGYLLGPVGKAITLFMRFRQFGGITGIVMRVAAGVQRAAPMLVRGFGLMRTAGMFLAKGLMRAGLMMLANPMILGIMALVAAGALLYIYWEPIKAFFIGLWNQVYAAFTGPMGTIMTLLFPFIGIPIKIYQHWGLISGFFSSVWANVKAAVQNPIAYFSSLPQRFGAIGGAIMQGLISALNPVLLVARLISIAKSGLTAFKNYFGIKSPSRVFMGLGGHLTEGLAMGLDRGGKRPLKSMARIAAGIGGAAALGIAGPSFAGGGGGATGSAANAGAARSVTYNVTINLTAGGDAKLDARAIKRELDALLAIDARGNYSDG